MVFAPAQSTAAEVIDGVNALRASCGLAPYQTNSILMRVCQDQADYMASIGTYSDTDAQGRGAGERALAAGYPLAGDLSLGGLISENVFWGNNATAQDAINFWTGDALHRIALFDTGFRDVGAGVAVVGSAYFYCQIAALSTGGKAVPYTPNPKVPTAAPLIINTPNADGSITYIIRPGDTLFSIAFGYGVSLATLEHLNNLTGTTIIYPGRRLIIRPASSPAVSPTPGQSTALPTQFPTQPEIPTPFPSGSPTGRLSAPSSTVTTPQAGVAVIIIAAAALLFAGVITAVAGKPRS